ncbi:MAG: class I SAM-dependent methyltransferase, partial [Candidatus Saccharimonadales bacterium]
MEIRDLRVLYLEFGVYQGESMQIWSSLLRNPESKLHGFDSFEGLPETWNTLHERGRFTVNGVPPEINDTRVVFFKGWFNETLSRYTLPDREALFINIDSDLYSSAKVVLDFLRPHITSGTYLYFDEFHHREHELKVFDELLQETELRFRLIVASRQFSHVL